VTRRGVWFADEVFKSGELTPIRMRAKASDGHIDGQMVNAGVNATLVLLVALFVLRALLFGIQVTYLCRSLSAPIT